MDLNLNAFVVCLSIYDSKYTKFIRPKIVVILYKLHVYNTINLFLEKK